MADKEASINPLAKTLVTLTDKLQSIKGGRLILAFATGAMNVLPVTAAIGTGVLEYKNLYASAATDEKIALLAARIDEVSKALNDHVDRLNLLFGMIEDISVGLKDYLDPQAMCKLDDMDAIAGSLLKPSAAEPVQDFIAANQLDILLAEKSYEVLLLRLDELPQLPPERSRLMRTKALNGLGKFEDLYVLLKKELFTRLSQEELENFIWSCFQLGYAVDGIKALQYHEDNFHSNVSQLFRSAVKARFFRGTLPKKEKGGI